MFIDGKWYTEPEVKAYIHELKKKLEENNYVQELEKRADLLKKFLQCVRAYFGTSVGWVDLFEDDCEKLIGGLENDTFTGS